MLRHQRYDFDIVPEGRIVPFRFVGSALHTLLSMETYGSSSHYRIIDDVLQSPIEGPGVLTSYVTRVWSAAFNDSLFVLQMSDASNFIYSWFDQQGSEWFTQYTATVPSLSFGNFSAWSIDDRIAVIGSTYDSGGVFKCLWYRWDDGELVLDHIDSFVAPHFYIGNPGYADNGFLCDTIYPAFIVQDSSYPANLIAFIADRQSDSFSDEHVMLVSQMQGWALHAAGKGDRIIIAEQNDLTMHTHVYEVRIGQGGSLGSVEQIGYLPVPTDPEDWYSYPPRVGFVGDRAVIIVAYGHPDTWQAYLDVYVEEDDGFVLAETISETGRDLSEYYISDVGDRTMLLAWYYDLAAQADDKYIAYLFEYEEDAPLGEIPIEQGMVSIGCALDGSSMMTGTIRRVQFHTAQLSDAGIQKISSRTTQPRMSVDGMFFSMLEATTDAYQRSSFAPSAAVRDEMTSPSEDPDESVMVVSFALENTTDAGAYNQVFYLDDVSVKATTILWEVSVDGQQWHPLFVALNQPGARYMLPQPTDTIRVRISSTNEDDWVIGYIIRPVFGISERHLTIGS